MLRFRPLWKFTALMLPLFLGCLALGMWQLERLHWKRGLVAPVQRNLHAPPISVDAALALGADKAQYHRVRLTGRFDHAKEVYAFATGEGGRLGYHIITPFTLNDGRVLLVDRGYVPERLRASSRRAAGNVTGEQRVTGVWRIPDLPGLFTPAPNLAKRVWYARDVNGIARADHVKLAAPVIVEANGTPNPGGWPKGGLTVVTFHNDHLQYAI